MNCQSVVVGNTIQLRALAKATGSTMLPLIPMQFRPGTVVFFLVACGSSTPRPVAPGRPALDAGLETATQADAGADSGRVDDADVAEVDAGPTGDPLPDARDQLALGGEHSCILRQEGDVWCWGSNRFGQMGQPDAEPGYRTRESAATPVHDFSARVLVSGTWHLCAIRDDRTVWCWGHGGWGQLGNGGTADSLHPVQATLEHAVGLAAGEGHTCARRSDRTVWCWGRNDRGQLGDGTREDRVEAEQVDGLEDVVELRAGRAFSCARTSEGQVLCWGENVDGQLGDGTRGAGAGSRSAPALVVGLGSASSLALGAGHGCAVVGAELFCWGRNDSMQLGSRPGGFADAAVTEPIAVPVEAEVQQVAAGSRHTCIRHASGVQCVGLNHRGQLGDRSRRLRRGLVDVTGLAATYDIAVGTEHSCAISATREVVCWGSNRGAQLGTGSRRYETRPTAVTGLPPGVAEESSEEEPADSGGVS